jgi:hypothetical protein
MLMAEAIDAMDEDPGAEPQQPHAQGHAERER